MKRRSRAALAWFYAFHSEVMTLSAIYSARGISKRFGVVQALSGVDLDVVQGKTLGLSADDQRTGRWPETRTGFPRDFSRTSAFRAANRLWWH